MNKKIIISLFFLGIGVVQAAQGLPLLETPPPRRRSINRPNNLTSTTIIDNYEYNIMETFIGSDLWHEKNVEILQSESTMLPGDIRYKEHWKNRLKTMKIDNYRALSLIKKYPGEWNEIIAGAALRYLNVLIEYEIVLNQQASRTFLSQEGGYSDEEIHRTHTDLKMNIFRLDRELGFTEDSSDEDYSDDEMEIDSE